MDLRTFGENYSTEEKKFKLHLNEQGPKHFYIIRLILFLQVDFSWSKVKWEV